MAGSGGKGLQSLQSRMSNIEGGFRLNAGESGYGVQRPKLPSTVIQDKGD
jgi:hypothetical protein